MRSSGVPIGAVTAAAVEAAGAGTGAVSIVSGAVVDLGLPLRFAQLLAGSRREPAR